MSDADTATRGPAMLRVPDVGGAPAALGRRLADCDARPAERTAIAHDRGAQTTIVRARDTAALEWLYDWLETVEGDRRVESAARQLVPAVRDELDARLVADGGDIERFDHAGVKCKIRQAGLGHWCGYVRRPEAAEPVRWTADYDSKHGEVLAAEVDVWGGITYGPDDDGWVGFDDAHATALASERDADSDRAAVRAETKRLAEQVADLVDTAEREPGDGESYGDGGQIRPVPPGVPDEPEGSDVE